MTRANTAPTLAQTSFIAVRISYSIIDLKLQRPDDFERPLDFGEAVADVRGEAHAALAGGHDDLTVFQLANDRAGFARGRHRGENRRVGALGRRYFPSEACEASAEPIDERGD